MELGQADRMLPAPGNLERAELEAVDQPRARAHSTGAGSESGQGTEQSLRSVASRVRLEALTPEGTLQGAHSAAAALNSTSTMAPAIEQQEGSTSGQRLGSRQGSGQAPPASQRLEQGGQETAEGWPSNLTNRPEPGLAGPSGEAEAGPEPVSNENAYEMIATEAGANLQALRLLRKSSFTCTLLGARQTGKRTIVKCFVKLLNEFKLAADEYKKEKLLTKLVECSERLHQLQAEVGADGQVSSEGPEGPERRWGRTARLNSWLGMNKLRLNLSPGGKRRLHSVVGLWAPKEATDQQQQQQRRHTTFEPSLGPTATTSFINQQQQQQQRASGPRRFLGVQDARSAMLSCSNKSDSNLNYSVLATSEPQPPPPPPPPVASSSQQLCIHVPDAAQLTKRQSQSPGEPLLRATDRKPMNVPPQAAWRRHTNALVSISAAGTDRRPPTSTTGGRGRPAARKQSTAAALTKRRQRQLLSLKELNRRRCGIKFRTRRQISESCLEQLKRPVIDEIRRRASSLAPQEGPVESSSFASPAQLELPDAFLVVYSINDRESFEYAKELIKQLRVNRLDLPLPIVLVANKIDLERARVVRNEEGRTVARKNNCKFMEISCTVGFNLDNLLVGLRTQLVLRHHIILNSILKGKHVKPLSPQVRVGSAGMSTTVAKKQANGSDKTRTGENILVRLYRRYLLDSSEQSYDCDNFSKL